METPNIHEDSQSRPIVQDTMPSTGEESKTIVVDKEEPMPYDIDLNSSEDDSKPVYRNGEPIITTGRDISRFVVDIRDNGDPALTFRSIILGSLVACVGAALGQIYVYKPVQVGVSGTFLLLLVYSAGNAWAKFCPKSSWVVSTRLEFLIPILDFINLGPFSIKEHVIASMLASTAAGGSAAVQVFAVQKLYYNTNVQATTAILATFSMACLGYGLVGILRPLTVYPSEMVYWGILPTVTIFQTLHFNDNTVNLKRVKLFWTAFTAMFLYEIFPAYIFPLLNGINIVCLATQKASQRTVDIITNLFGGTNGNEGLGLLAFCFDWQYITSGSMVMPLIQQANSWIGIFFCYIVIMVIYYTNTWNSKAFPMITSSIFSSNGSIYDQSAVFDSQFQLNRTALDIVGLPALSGSYAWAMLVNNLGIGGMIVHVALFWGSYGRESLKLAYRGEQSDLHYLAVQKYKEVPWWWYAILLCLSFIAGLIVVLIGQTTLPWWLYIVSLFLGLIITPFAIILCARLGSGIVMGPLAQMIAGAVYPGRPVANLYFSMWSLDFVNASIGLSENLKMGQYLKIPPRVMFLTQIWGTILGAFVSYAVMVSVVDAQRDILLSPTGTNVWSGQSPQTANSSALTWSLVKDIFGFNGPYWIIPLGLVIGTVPTTIQWLISKRWPKIGPIKVSSIVLPVIYQYSGYMSVGSNSFITSGIVVGVVSQVWLRNYHPGWYRKYNYVLGGALDGGAQVMIFILSFAVFGAAGVQRRFPTWAGNPTVGNVDYCNGNGALHK